MRLESECVFLRSLTAVDATPEYAAWLNDPEVNRFLETRHSLQTVESCCRFIESMNRDTNNHLFGVFMKKDGRHIGNAKLGFINPRYLNGQLSLFIGDKSCWGKGIGREIVRTLTTYGFQSLKLERIEAGCYEDNLASLRIFLGNHYTVEGFLRDHAVFEGRRTGIFWLGILKHEHS